MQPIPYEPLPGDSAGAILLKVAVGVLIIAGGLFFRYLGKRNRGGKEAVADDLIAIFSLLLGFIFISTAVSPTLRYAPDPEQINVQTKAAQAEIRDSYGLKLSKDQAAALKYPTDPPKDKFEVYGSFEERKQTEGKAFKSRTIYLVWSDGSLGLSESSDGKAFTPLKEAR